MQHFHTNNLSKMQLQCLLQTVTYSSNLIKQLNSFYKTLKLHASENFLGQNNFILCTILQYIAYFFSKKMFTHYSICLK